MEPTISLDQSRAGMAPLEGLWREITLGFLIEKAGRTGSQRTVEAYGRTIGRFLMRIEDPATATPWDVHRFAFSLCPNGRPPSASTVSVRLAAVRSFYDFARRMKVVEVNPAADVRRPAAQRPQPRGLALDEIAALLSVIPDSPSGLLDRAMVVTALLTGLRRSELVGLSVSFAAEFVQYEVRTKGGMVRRRELPEPAWGAIELAAASAGRVIAAGAPAFTVADATFYAHLRRHAKAAGLSNVSPHVLRHTAAKLRRAAGASIEDVSAMLGHESIATTATYLRRLENDRDDGWEGVAEAMGLIGPQGTRVGSQSRSRPIQTERQDGRANSRPATWIGGVCAPLPGRDPTPGGEPGQRRGRRSAGRRAKRRGAPRSRRTRTQSQLPALRR